MRRKCWNAFPIQRLQRKPLVSDPGMHHKHMHHARAVMYVGFANPQRIPGAIATRDFAYLGRGP